MCVCVCVCACVSDVDDGVVVNGVGVVGDKLVR